MLQPQNRPGVMGNVLVVWLCHVGSICVGCRGKHCTSFVRAGAGSGVFWRTGVMFASNLECRPCSRAEPHIRIDANKTQLFHEHVIIVGRGTVRAHWAFFAFQSIIVLGIHRLVCGSRRYTRPVFVSPANVEPSDVICTNRNGLAGFVFALVGV